MLRIHALSSGWILFPTVRETAWLLPSSGVAAAVRLSRWRGAAARSEPLVWILHAGYGFVPLGMLGVGGAILWPDILPPASALHLWMAGAIGVMTLAVMTRATLGHSGRALTAGAGTAAVYLLVIASVFTRISGGALQEQAMALWTLSALLWCCGFVGFVLIHGRLLIGPAQR